MRRARTIALVLALVSVALPATGSAGARAVGSAGRAVLGGCLPGAGATQCGVAVPGLGSATLLAFGPNLPSCPPRTWLATVTTAGGASLTLRLAVVDCARLALGAGVRVDGPRGAAVERLSAPR